MFIEDVKTDEKEAFQAALTSKIGCGTATPKLNKKEKAKMKKRLLAMLLAALMTGSLAACGGSGGNTADNSGTTAGNGSSGAQADTQQPADNGGGEGTYNISMILKTTAAEYWQFVMNGAQDYAAEHDGITVEVKGPSSETAFDEQQNMIETDLANVDYDGYIIAPLQSDMVATLVADTEKPVMAVDTNFESPKKLSFIGTGNESAAALGGAAAVEAAKAAGWEEIKCIEIAGVQGDQTCTDRMNGYNKGVTEAGGEFLVNEVQYADAVADRAVTCMEAIMQTHPEGIAIICANNDDMAMGAARAAQGNAAYANTIFLGFNGDKAACEAILNNQLTMSVAQMAYEMGYKAVETMVQALNGEAVEAFVDSGADVVTMDNAQTRLDTLKEQLG